MQGRIRIVLLLGLAVLCLTWMPARASPETSTNPSVLAKPTRKPTRTPKPRVTATKQLPTRTPAANPTATTGLASTSTSAPVFSPTATLYEQTQTATGTGVVTSTVVSVPSATASPANTMTATALTSIALSGTATSATSGGGGAATSTGGVPVNAAGTVTPTSTAPAWLTSSAFTATSMAAGAVGDPTNPDVQPASVSERSNGSSNLVFYLIFGIGLILVLFSAYLIVGELRKRRAAAKAVKPAGKSK